MLRDRIDDYITRHFIGRHCAPCLHGLITDGICRVRTQHAMLALPLSQQDVGHVRYFRSRSPRNVSAVEKL